MFTILCHHHALSTWSMIFHYFRFSGSDNQFPILAFHLNQTTNLKTSFFQPVSFKDDRWCSFIVVSARFIYFHFSKFLKCHNIASLALPCFRLEFQTLYRMQNHPRICVISPTAPPPLHEKKNCQHFIVLTVLL